MSATYAKEVIDMGVTDIEKIANAIHKGWNVTAKKFVENPDQFDDTEKLRQSGKLDNKIQQRKKLMNIDYNQLSDAEKEKDRVVARALLQSLKKELSESITPETIHKLADDLGIEWDNEPSFLELTKELTGKEHLDDLNQAELMKVKNHLEKQNIAETEEFTMDNVNENHMCPICGGELVSELLMNEKKDACYYKVKSRYKVWPSAYASGALVKCRKKGAKNWGNKSEGVEELDEKWSKKYKRSIDCSHPKGFSQKAHCQGRKKNEETLMKEEQLKNIIREMVEEMYNEQNQMQDECWECYEAAMEEGTNEAYEECYRKTNWEMVPEGEEHTCEGDEFYEIYGDINADAKENLTEAEYRGRKVKLGKPMRGDVKKFKVFVRNPTTGKVKKVNFGDKKMRIKKSNPKRRKSFRARHNCANPGPRTKARYWSCRKW
jgi:transcriptional regulator with XRE-family HTH domain